MSENESNDYLNSKNCFDDKQSKKPSYLSLACCVNGYSNLTTYDSKVRQDINKSREVSPIRPSSNVTVQYCKNKNSVTPPVLNKVKSKESVLIESEINTKKLESNEAKTEQVSFIQQRVERLYGPGALAQAFYSPKKTHVGNNPIYKEDSQSPELIQKFKQISPNRDYQKLNNLRSIQPSFIQNRVLSEECENSVDLPVLRHLSQEFRSQLPSISPKRSYLRNATDKKTNDNEALSTTEISLDLLDHSAVVECNADKLITNLNNVELKQSNSSERDGNYFLNILKSEQDRILKLADEAEIHIEMLSANPEIPEDSLGFLRSASGKARLLVSQKMKQFEGLCHSNLNRTQEDEFPTTIDDLQGFWDMVCLQIEHVNSIFDEVAVLKRNNWIKPVDDTKKTDFKNEKKLNNKTVKLTNTPNINKVKTGEIKSAAALKREAQRKQLLELKRKNRIALNAESSKANDDILNS
ncbi:uncharacterized protein LOC119678590 isoform X3 [Teleopsis dalmanni]|nr:uncharacterized protein LOC119678590 isoform X3 [Teleopsis dalmanni]XP_037946437.1 uncharacterized protein LOC119678590 isoform X3 [Teleopsis dalmanni]XP_037946438.1 uncharacterized protein LOC119678590 isoform X3 [Teleopsis dalmanni]XP_037946439.1 uncharacterized protein LOC119678590 isoform X3 [Teleopsis dalmanni]